jgi:hypothetical protein
MLVPFEKPELDIYIGYFIIRILPSFLASA